MAGFLLLGLVSVGLIFLKVQHDFKFYEGKTYWNNILFQGICYYGNLKFIPLIGGIILGISQYFPETVEKRIKLTFHLPINENKVLLQMMAYGTILLSAIYLLVFALFWGMSTVFFPKEIIADALITIAPWFMAGYAAYFLIGLIVLEPIWRYRFFYILIAVECCRLYVQHAIAAGYSTINLTLLVITLALSISLLFSGYRFRKGEQ